jgi:hypothetical protein
MALNNSFVNLDVPVGQGTGAGSDISSLSPEISLVVTGAVNATGDIVVEISGDGVNFAPATSTFPINNPPASFLKLVARFARVRRFNGSGAASVSLGAAKTSMNIFGFLSFVALDTSEMGPFKTLIVAGTYPRAIIIEASNNGVTYDAIANFNTQGSAVLALQGIWMNMRVRSNTDLGGVVISIGAGVSTSVGILRTELGVNDRDGFGLDMLGIVHERDFVIVYPPEITNAMDALILTNQRALTGQEQATAAFAAGFRKYDAETPFQALLDQPEGVKQASFEFSEGVPLDAGALFITAQLVQTQTFDNVGHTPIQVSLGVIGDLEKYLAKTDVTNPANAGKTFTTPGDANLILLAPIGSDAPLVTFYSVDDLNTATAGFLIGLIFYTSP